MRRTNRQMYHLTYSAWTKKYIKWKHFLFSINCRYRLFRDGCACKGVIEWKISTYFKKKKSIIFAATSQICLTLTGRTTAAGLNQPQCHWRLTVPLRRRGLYKKKPCVLNWQLKVIILIDCKRAPLPWITGSLYSDSLKHFKPCRSDWALPLRSHNHCHSQCVTKTPVTLSPQTSSTITQSWTK